MSDGAGRRFFGALLIAVGGLIATLSGLCSFDFVVVTFGQALKGPAVLTNLLLGCMLVAVVGGLPFVAGVALVIAGRAVMRVKPGEP